MRRNTQVILAAVLVIIAFNPGLLFAGFSDAASSPIVVDVRPPDVEILAPTTSSILYGLTVETLSWSVYDDHPADDLHLQTTTILVNGIENDSIQMESQEGVHTWTWTVPNISSGTNVMTVSVRDAYGNIATRNSENFMILLNDTGVIGSPPNAAHLDAPYPNPFNPKTKALFGLPVAGHATVSIHDLRGRRLRTLLDEHREAGTWSLEWDGRNDMGRLVPAGPYLIRLDLDGKIVQTRKAVLLP